MPTELDSDQLVESRDKGSVQNDILIEEHRVRGYFVGNKFSQGLRDVCVHVSLRYSQCRRAFLEPTMSPIIAVNFLNAIYDRCDVLVNERALHICGQRVWPLTR